MNETNKSGLREAGRPLGSPRTDGEPARYSGSGASSGTGRLCIAATFTADPVEPVCEFWFREFGLDLQVGFAPYNQVLQQIHDPSSLLLRNSGGVNALLIRFSDCLRFSGGEGDETRRVASFAQEIGDALRGVARGGTSWVVMCCPENDRALEPEVLDAVRESEAGLARELGKLGSVSVIQSSAVGENYGLDGIWDPSADEAGHVPYSSKGFAAVGSVLARKIRVLSAPPRKVLVLDCDNTLWGGVCGESNPADLVMDGAYRALQEFALEQKDAGMLLCLCSKNAEDDVRRVFDVRSDMALKWKDITAARINWTSKAENLEDLARQLDLGTDSFVMLDDNPVECAEIRARRPEVATLQVPGNADEIPRFLRHAWVFDRWNVTGEDRRRSEFYRQNAARRELREASTGFRDFLDSLDLRVNIGAPVREAIPRAAQLTQRTNQFNTTALRRNEADIAALVDGDAEGECLVARVSDRFGDYGLVGLMSLRMDGDRLVVDSFLLSCRVLGRGVEHRMLAELGARAKARGCDEIDVLFDPTGRNEPARAFFAGFADGEERGDGGVVYRIPADDAGDAGSRIAEAGPVEAKPASTGKGRVKTTEDSELFQWIATELCTAGAVASRVRGKLRPRPALGFEPAAARGEIEERVADIWREELGVDGIGVTDAFNDLGGTSLQMVRVHSRLLEESNVDLPLTDLFQLPTVRDIASRIEGGSHPAKVESPGGVVSPESPATTGGIAVIGMSARLPGAWGVEQFWENLKGGVESISRFSTEELAASGVDVSQVREDSDYVPAKGLMPGIEEFDAAFFGIIPRDAQLMDPQQRIFMELAWEAFEASGYDIGNYPGAVGVFAGEYIDTYLLSNLCSNREFLRDLVSSIQVGSLQTELGNDKDYLATRIAYKFNLRGPAMTVQSACSTSMVAICQACNSLARGDCEMALAGGITITLPERRGYFYKDGGMLSNDGHCRPFDAGAQGTVFGNGGAAVVLKRLEDAIRDGDPVRAVIKGWALNNDGGIKHSYTAPSVDGQAEVIRLAQDAAGVNPDTIGYIEAHGTATPLGDPIEIAGLTRAFRERGATGTNYCAVGSLKSNVGHLDVASGVTALIKTTLCLENKTLAPTLHYEKPNPKIPFEESPFFVNAECRPWEHAGEEPRRAGISSFGVGGTNGHLVVEEAPEPAPAAPSSRRNHLIVVSARSDATLERGSANLARHLAAGPDAPLADMAWTLAAGRKAFGRRRAVVAESPAAAAALLEKKSGRGVATGRADNPDAPVVFMFPGQGAQRVRMGRALYETEPVFREQIDYCAERLEEHLGEDIRSILYPGDAGVEDAALRLKQTVIAQPAIFMIEYAYARLFLQAGVKPAAMIGHSVGEFVAACLAGVFTLDEGLALLAARGRLMQDLPGGAMLSVRLPREDLVPLIPGKLDLAAVNGPSLCVVAGPCEEAEAFRAQLDERGVPAKQLHTSHGFHSWMMEPILEAFEMEVAKANLKPPATPIRSTVTTGWLRDEEACDPGYWARHLRQTVRFHETAAHFWNAPDHVLLEVGPGQTLATLAKQNPDKATKAKQLVLASSGHAQQAGDDDAFFLEALGKLWTAGIAIDWQARHAAEDRRRVSLPTYPFERKRFWIEPTPFEESAPPADPQTLTEPQTPINTPQPMIQEIPTDTVGAAEERARKILEEVTAVLADMSGMEPEELEPDASYLELGFDSLLLTQVGKELKDAFGVKITMRQLIDEITSPAKTVELLDRELPADRYEEAEAISAPAARERACAPVVAPPAPVPHAAAPAAPPPASMPVGVPGSLVGSCTDSAVERVINKQLELMRGQLVVLGGGGQTASPPPQEPETPREEPAAAPGERPVAPAPANGRPQPLTRNGNGNGNRDVALEAENALKDSEPSEGETKSFGPFRGAIAKKKETGLTDRQERHLRELTERYTKKTARSKELAQRHRAHFADPRTVSGFNRLWKEMVYPITVERGKGSRLFDIDGNEYVDILNGFGCNFLGHSPDYVTEALHSQLDLGVQIGPQSPLAGEVAELITGFSGLERVSFFNTGSEAVQAAIRAARTATGRDKIAFFSKDYHGNFDEVLVRGAGSPQKPRSLPIAPGIPRRSVEDVLVLPYGSEESLETLRKHAHELAAVLVEPMQSRRPEFQPREFIQAVRKLTEESGTVLVFDEVITGFRVGPGGAQEWYGIKADLATYGKVAGGGMPIGILAGRAEFMDTLDGGFWQYGDDSFPEKGVTFFAGTFVRHPLAMAGAKAALLHMKAQGPEFWEAANARAARLAGSVDRMFRENGLDHRMPHFCTQMFLRVPEDEKFGELLYLHLREKGVFIMSGLPSYLTVAHSDEDIDFVVGAFEESIKDLQDGGFFLKPAGGNMAAALVEEEALRALDAAPMKAPVTAAQKEVWLACQLSTEANCVFNEQTTLRLRGELDVVALRAALQSVVARHDILRANFSEDGETMAIAPQREVDLPLVDLSDAPPEERERRMSEQFKAEGFTPFDLTSDPLIRASLLKLGSDEHVLFLTIHHSICDGWSYAVVVEDLSEFYNASLTGTPVSLEAVRSFRDYALWLEGHRDREEAVDSAAYWRKVYATPCEGMIDLPVDNPRPRNRSFRAGSVVRPLDDDALKSLRKLAGKIGVTPYNLVFAAYAVLMARLSGQDEIVLGIPAAGRDFEGADNMVGHTVNLLPIRLNPAPGQEFPGFARDVKSAILDAYEHENFSYGELIRELSLPRSGGRMPLAEIGFNMMRMDYHQPLDGLETRYAASRKSFLNYTLFLHIFESARDGTVIHCDYDLDVFEAATIQRWIGHFRRILSEIVERPETRLADLPLMEPAEKHRVVVDWNDTSTEYPADASVHALFEEVAAANPERIALVSDAGELTYAELDSRARRVAAMMVRHGVKPSDRVGIAIGRSPDMIAGLLGILKAGASYVPLDGGYPAERIAFMIEDAGLSAVLCQRDGGCPLPEGCRVSCLHVEDAPEDDAAGNPDLPEVGAADPAYVIYTSGSQGTPKGTLVPHRAVVRLVRETNYANLDENEVILQAAPVSFDASTFEIWGSLLNGGRLVLLPAGEFSLGEVARVLKEQAVTTLWLTAGLFQAMVDEHLDDLKGLRQLLAGGDVLSPAHVARVLEALPECRLINGYGPTENTTFTCCHTIGKADLALPSIPIGKPIANTRVYILDGEGKPAPVGVPGELCIAGDGLADGYLNRPELTEEKFIERTIAGRVERLYRSGDLCRWLPDGSIEFFHRIDNQVKIRGFRVELGEIESILTEHQSVQRVVVAVRGDTAGSKALVAYAVPTNGAIDTDAVRAYLAKRLPSFMIPSSIVPIESLPVTPNGKIDYRALPEPGEGVKADTPKVERSAASPLEEKVLDIWKSVLDFDQIGIGDDFFDLGGHSIMGLRIISRIEKDLGCTLPLGALFTCPTPALLAEAIEDELGQSGVPENGAREIAPDEKPEVAETGSNGASQGGVCIEVEEESAGGNGFVIPIQPHGNRPPLFCVHGGDGGVLFYKDLADKLGGSQPFYAIEAPILTSQRLDIYGSVEEAAALYTKELRRNHPDGPYLLGGYSFGGVVAYEMAHRLVNEGAEVEMLAVFDTDNPAHSPQLLNLAERAAVTWKKNAGMGIAGKLKRLGGRVKFGIANRVKTIAENAAAERRTRRGEKCEGDLLPVQVREIHARLMEAYKPEPYRGRMTLFRADDPGDLEVRDEFLGWGDVAEGGVEVVPVPGAHLTIFDRPHVFALADAVRNALAETARSETASG